MVHAHHGCQPLSAVVVTQACCNLQVLLQQQHVMRMTEHHCNCRAVSAQNAKSTSSKDDLAQRDEWRRMYGEDFFKRGTNPPEVVARAKVAVKDRRGGYGLNGKLLQKYIDAVLALLPAP